MNKRNGLISENTGVSFAHALTVFRDPLAKTVPDEAHSETEERWVTIGCTPTGESLLFVHTWTEMNANTAKIRMISARKATNTERKDYEEGIERTSKILSTTKSIFQKASAVSFIGPTPYCMSRFTSIR